MGKASDRIGPFVFDRSRMALTKEGEVVPLGGRAAALLRALLDARGTVVAKKAPIAAAWKAPLGLTTSADSSGLSAARQQMRLSAHHVACRERGYGARPHWSAQPDQSPAFAHRIALVCIEADNYGVSAIGET